MSLTHPSFTNPALSRTAGSISTPPQSQALDLKASVRLGKNEIRSVNELVHELCGLALDDSKVYLIESRLGPIIRDEQLSSYAELVSRARVRTNERLRHLIIDAITTHETMFFRDAAAFDALRCKAIPESLDVRAATAFPKTLRIWSAASSTGQEAYSVSIILHELIPDVHRWDIQILATDISNASIAKASRGIFTDMDVGRGLPKELRDKYFHRVGADWQVNDSLRSLIAFRRLNLLDSFSMLGPFDIVLCRNVAIYFQPEQQTDLFQRIKRVMTRDGYLFVGGSESLLRVGPEFRPHAHCRSTFYRPNLGA